MPVECIRVMLFLELKNRQGPLWVAVTMQDVWKHLMEDGRRSYFPVTR